MNENDLLTNGTTTEYDLLNTEWNGVRPVNAAGYETNIKQQLLVLNIQKASLERQIVALAALVAQISPTPTGDPEATTVSEATTSLSQATSALADVNNALTNTQGFYDDTLVGGDWSDAAVVARWFYLTGVDATGTPTTDPLPVAPVTGDGRIDQVAARIAFILTRLGQINTTLGFDNTATPTGFESIDTSENLYTMRYTILDLRLNRESGTLFKARSGHSQYVKDITEAALLQSLLSTFGG